MLPLDGRASEEVRPLVRAGRVLAQLLRVGSLALCIGFVSLEAVYVLPPNPLRDELRPAWDLVVGRLFWQGWGVFRRPPTEDYSAQIRCSRGRLASSWIDLSDLLSRVPRQPWFLLSRPAFYVEELVHHEEELRRPAKTSLSSAAPESLANQLQDQQERWARLGSEACKDMFGQTWPAQVEVRYTVQPFHPWVERAAADKLPAKSVDVGGYAVRDDVAALGLFPKQAPPAAP